jgi:ABC-2 type transport system ATP-binding protein
MKSQLALSLALLGDPDLLILDEPTDGLDAVRRNQFFNIVLDMVAEEEKAVFLTTNTIADVEKIADHTGLIRGGKLCLDGETGSLVENSRKVRVAFAEGCTPDLEHWPGVRRVERENRSYLLHIGGNAEDILERLKALPTVFLDVFRMSLEDIFLDINGGRD